MPYTSAYGDITSTLNVSIGRTKIITLDHKLSDEEAELVIKVWDRERWPAWDQLNAFLQKTEDKAIWAQVFKKNKESFVKHAEALWQQSKGPGLVISNGYKARFIPRERAVKYTLSRLEMIEKAYPEGLETLYFGKFQVRGGRCLSCGYIALWRAGVASRTLDLVDPCYGMNFWFDVDPSELKHLKFLGWLKTSFGPLALDNGLANMAGTCLRCSYQCVTCLEEQPRQLDYARFLEYQAEGQICTKCISSCLARVLPPKLELSIIKARLKGGTAWM